WEMIDDVWICKKCEHRTHDNFMQIDGDSERTLQTVTFKDFTKAFEEDRERKQKEEPDKQSSMQLITETGKTLLRLLANAYILTTEQEDNTGKTRDDIAYSYLVSETIEPLGFTTKQARLCIYAALKDLEKRYAFKPDTTGSEE